jgi:uncharacterized protein (TIGR02391 family)
MASKRIERPVLISKEFTVPEIDRGIVKIRKRIEQVNSLKGLRHGDATIHVVERDVRDTIRDIFGPTSPEFHDHEHDRIWDGPMYMQMPDYEIQTAFEAGIVKTTKILDGLIARLEEKKQDLGLTSKEDKPDTDFWALLHPRIAQIARPRFESGHFADSVEAAFKEINASVKELVRRKTGTEFDGSDLMNRAFSPTKPVVTLDDLSTESGKNIQQGFMQIFAGAMIGIRNPKTHENIIIDKQRAIHFLFLASLLMFKFDERIG